MRMVGGEVCVIDDVGVLACRVHGGREQGRDAACAAGGGRTWRDGEREREEEGERERVGRDGVGRVGSAVMMTVRRERRGRGRLGRLLRTARGNSPISRGLESDRDSDGLPASSSSTSSGPVVSAAHRWGDTGWPSSRQTEDDYLAEWHTDRQREPQARRSAQDATGRTQPQDKGPGVYGEPSLAHVMHAPACN